MSDFAAQVSAEVAQAKEAIEAVFHEAAQEVVEEMLKVGPSVASTKAAIAHSKRKIGPVAPAGEGGHLPVDTGFMRWSFRASTEVMPEIDTSAYPAEGAKYAFDSGPINLVINGAEIGDTIYIGATAAYARPVNYGHGTFQGYLFVEKAAQRWPAIVAAAEARFLRELHAP
jgi:hypothetical protein